MRQRRQCETSAKARTAGNQRGRRPCNSSCPCHCTSMFRPRPLSRIWTSGSTWGSSWRTRSRCHQHQTDHPRPDPKMGLVTRPTPETRLGTYRDEPKQNHPASRLAWAGTWIGTSLDLDQGNHRDRHPSRTDIRPKSVRTLEANKRNVTGLKVVQRLPTPAERTSTSNPCGQIGLGESFPSPPTRSPSPQQSAVEWSYRPSSCR